MEQCRRLMDRDDQDNPARDAAVTFDSSEVGERSWRTSQRQMAADGRDRRDSGLQVLVDVAEEDDEEEEDSSTPRQRPRRSSFGSTSPKVRPLLFTFPMCYRSLK